MTTKSLILRYLIVTVLLIFAQAASVQGMSVIRPTAFSLNAVIDVGTWSEVAFRERRLVVGVNQTNLPYKASQQAHLILAKSRMASFLPNYIDISKTNSPGTWDAYFSIPIATNPSTGALIYPSSFPFSSTSSVINALNLPTNYFSYTPPKGIDPLGLSLTNYPALQAGRTSQDYGWTNLCRVIKLMQEHTVLALFSNQQITTYYNDGDCDNISNVTNTFVNFSLYYSFEYSHQSGGNVLYRETVSDGISSYTYAPTFERFSRNLFARDYEGFTDLNRSSATFLYGIESRNNWTGTISVVITDAYGVTTTNTGGPYITQSNGNTKLKLLSTTPLPSDKSWISLPFTYTFDKSWKTLANNVLIYFPSTTYTVQVLPKQYYIIYNCIFVRRPDFEFQ